MTDILRLNSICRKNHLDLSNQKLENLKAYVQTLLEWNEKINLISRNDVLNVWFSHILHSVSILFYVKLNNGLKLLDLGSGGGLPGIPLAIVREDLKVTLIDSIRKKMIAVEDMVGRLNLSNVDVITGRAEVAGASQPLAGQYDAVVSRAVAPLCDLIKWSRPLVKRGNSRLITLKGGDLENELREARIKTGIKDPSVFNLVFEGSEVIGLEGKKLVVVNI